VNTKPGWTMLTLSMFILAIACRGDRSPDRSSVSQAATIDCTIGYNAWADDGVVAVSKADAGHVWEKMFQTPSPVVREIIDRDHQRISSAKEPVLTDFKIGHQPTWEWGALYCLSEQADLGKPEALNEVLTTFHDGRDTRSIRDTIRLLAGGTDLGSSRELLAYRKSFEDLQANPNYGDSVLQEFATNGNFLDLVRDTSGFLAKYEKDLVRSEQAALYLQIKSRGSQINWDGAARLCKELQDRGVLPK
jgi:hypothetical protein